MSELLDPLHRRGIEALKLLSQARGRSKLDVAMDRFPHGWQNA
jgi:hypothetical protein